MQWAKAIFLFLLLAVPLQAQPLREQTPEPADNHLSYGDAIILGLVEGITEYLPISSTGHLILTNRLLGLDAETPVLDKAGDPILIEGKTEGELRPYTIGDAAYAYVIVIQAGAIIAVVMLYWRSILKIALGCLGKSASGRRLAVNLITAFLPAAVIGLLLDSTIESMLGDNVIAVASALVVGAFVMFGVERWRKRRNGPSGAEEGPELHDLSIKQSLMIGFIQCFAMWPGTSRSMATIVGGYLVGLSPKRAAEFSFLLGLITLTAASGYKFVTNGEQMLMALDVGPVLVGCLVALISALLAVKWLVGFLSKHGLALFAWYRIALAAAVFLIFLT